MNRRNFLGSILAAGASFMILPSSATGRIWKASIPISERWIPNPKLIEEAFTLNMAEFMGKWRWITPENNPQGIVLYKAEYENFVSVEKTMKLIPLTKGQYASVDDSDFELVSKYKWRCRVDPTNKRMYAVTTIRKKGKRSSLPMHRMILDHHKQDTDHEDGNGLNNQRHNLRAATRIENMQNQNVRVHSARFKGVSLDKRTGHNWRAMIRVNRKLFNVGYFYCPIKAARAYDEAAMKHFGEFSKTNEQLGLYVELE